MIARDERLLALLVASTLMACVERKVAPPPADGTAPSGSDAAETLSEARSSADAGGGSVGSGAAAEPRDRPPLALGDQATIALPVPGFDDAVVVLPIGRRTPAPVVVAGHGNYDRPEWQCGVWDDLVQRAAFVLCPRGVARRDSPSPKDIRFTYSNASRFAAEIDAGLAALRARYADAIAPGPIVYVGFSLGAIFGATFALRPSSEVSRLVLVEGGHSSWTRDAARKFARGGGERVLFACGQSACMRDAKPARAALEKENVLVDVVLGAGEGHGYGGAVAAQIQTRWKWLIEGDPRFLDAP